MIQLQVQVIIVYISGTGHRNKVRVAMWQVGTRFLGTPCKHGLFSGQNYNYCRGKKKEKYKFLTKLNWLPYSAVD